jgi:hypothetical protein
MDIEIFKKAVDSMVGYPKMTGVMGGEPLLHPKFPEFCRYIKAKIPKEQLGLWTCLPKGYQHYSDIICETFGHIFINDHTREDIFHAPILIGSEEVFSDPREMFYATEHCWVQEAWSASINPKGAFFCEIAASLSHLLDGPRGWKVEPGWWMRVTKDFKEQREEWCPKCGAALPFLRRKSTEGIDDISPKNLARLKGRSKKVERGEFLLSDLKLVSCPQEMAAYKDISYRQRIANRYGIYLYHNEQNFLTPIRLKRS